MKVLVTGGLGFIGSHTVVELINAGFTPVIIDNLSNSYITVLSNIKKITNKEEIIFENIDLKDQQAVKGFFQQHPDIKGVIHFAASKAVGESVEEPLMYYQNNINSLVYLLKELQNLREIKFIFSSSCTVYGQPETMPVTEDTPRQKALSPYGNTKIIGEDIITDVANVSDIQAILLRYFNPIGAHESILIGELPIGVPQNLIPIVTQSAAGIREGFSVYGNDYPTPDGTCIRDYIDVVDLAKAHIAALKRLLDKKTEEKVEVFNIGTGKGTSVLEIINEFEKVNQVKLNYTIAPRRAGDSTIIFADTTKANNILGWKAEKTLTESLQNAWKWQQSLTK